MRVHSNDPICRYFGQAGQFKLTIDLYLPLLLANLPQYEDEFAARMFQGRKNLNARSGVRGENPIKRGR
jgi:hypothetical protein